jgi:type II secretory pathway pseudopilin PulG
VVLPTARGASDSGTTLPELLVSIILFGVVGAAVSVAIIATIRTTRGTDERVQNLSGAQLAVEDMSKLIQTAARLPVAAGNPMSPAIIVATQSELKFYGYDKPGSPPSIIDFSVSNGDLIETVTHSTNSGANACSPPYTYGGSRTRVLAQGLDDSPAIFSYATQPDAGGVVGGQPLTMTGSPPALSSAARDSVKLVTIQLEVDHDPNPGVAATVAKTVVALPNQLVPTPSLRTSAC